MVLWGGVFVDRWLEKPLEVAEDGDVFDDSSTDGELVLPPEYVDLPADIGYLETEENLVLPPEYEGFDGQLGGSELVYSSEGEDHAPPGGSPVELVSPVGPDSPAAVSPALPDPAVARQSSVVLPVSQVSATAEVNPEIPHASASALFPVEAHRTQELGAPFGESRPSAHNTFLELLSPHERQATVERLAATSPERSWTMELVEVHHAYPFGFFGTEEVPQEIEPFQHPSSFVDYLDRFDEGIPFENNCVEVARCVEAAWRGQLHKPLGRSLDENDDPHYENGELTEIWLDEKYEEVPSAQYLIETVQAAGHGASAIVGSYMGEDVGHDYNLANYHGQVILVDGQDGSVIEPHPHTIHPMFAHSNLSLEYPGRGSGNHESTTLKLTHEAIVIAPDGQRIVLNT